jgi:hypothetical protein
MVIASHAHSISKDLEERIKTLEENQEAAQEKEQMNEADDACGP